MVAISKKTGFYRGRRRAADATRSAGAPVGFRAALRGLGDAPRRRSISRPATIGRLTNLGQRAMSRLARIHTGKWNYPMSKLALIVDDSKVARMILSRMIKEIDSGWEIIEAADGAEGIDVAKAREPGTVVMDFNMPGIDGVDAARQIKELLPDAKITILTANIQKSTEEKAEKIGVGFLTKPLEKDDLAAFLKESRDADA
jgi:CheY-like chemotaxis protein